MNKRTIILVDPIRTGKQFVEYARSVGCETLAVYTLPERILIANNLINRVSLGHPALFATETDRIIDHVNRRRLNVVGVIPCSEPGVVLAAQLAQQLDLPGNAVETITCSRNKWLMRQELKKRKFRTPNFTRCRNNADIHRFLHDNHFPCVIKAPAGAGTDQVFVCNTRSDVEQKLAIILGKTNLFGCRNEYALLESYIRGQEYVVNLFAHDGVVTVTDIWSYRKRNTPDASFLYEDIILEDLSVLDEETIASVIAISRTFGLTNGSIHAEIKVEENGDATLIEIGARIAGGDLPVLVRDASNFDHFRENIGAFTDVPVQHIHDVRFHSHCQVVFCHCEQRGMVRGIHGLDNIAELPSYTGHHLNCGIGRIVTPTRDLQNMPLMVTLRHPSRKQVAKDAEQVRKHFILTVDEHRYRGHDAESADNQMQIPESLPDSGQRARPRRYLRSADPVYCGC